MTSSASLNRVKSFSVQLHAFSLFGSVDLYIRSLFVVGAEVDDERIELLLSEVNGKDVTELIAVGREKFASVPSGGAVAAVAVAAPSGAAPAAEEPKKEEKVEEKEESDEDMGFSLFD
ncbi:hypothetical protein Cni_G29427 [Canna indica]|uniref:Uncharacterized protein n=1 Tax=Canna indica TaxID=4628 RepID=A0AAQ3L4B9_9LILI|nr:hypothetical protein Cni_G29427 [Canna indica]